MTVDTANKEEIITETQLNKQDTHLNDNIDQLKQTLLDLKSKNTKLFKIEDNLIQDNIKISNKKMSLLACIEEMYEERKESSNFKYQDYESSSLEELAQLVKQYDNSFDLNNDNLSKDMKLNIEEYKKRVLGIK
ncbi:hypothetical protein ACO0SA_002765 [Hanseniaspora valbyensis]